MVRSLLTISLPALLLLSAVACGTPTDDDSGDGSVADGAVEDGGGSDGGRLDAGADAGLDGGGSDAGEDGGSDGGATDGGADGGTSDGGGADGGGADGGGVDGGATDGGDTDGGPMDAGPSCGCSAGQYCDIAGVCQPGPGPLGAQCSPSSSCQAGDPNFPACVNSHCASNLCMIGSFQIVANREVCTRACQIYQDDDDGQGNPQANGVNDLDAPESDCRPPEVMDGPAGTTYRCVNIADPAQNVQAYCLPGSDFLECNSNEDCPADEVCELGNRMGTVRTYCYARYRENEAWPGQIVRLGETCNNDPAAGPLVHCADGLCLDNGYCSAYCTATSGCDTTPHTSGQRCLAGTCQNASWTTCTSNSDCSTAECGGTLDLGGGLVFDYCTPR